MQDVNGLDQIKFTNKFDLEQIKSNIYNPQKRKEVSFLDKFIDSGPIDESKRWNICENKIIVPEKNIYEQETNLNFLFLLNIRFCFHEEFMLLFKVLF